MPGEPSLATYSLVSLLLDWKMFLEIHHMVLTADNTNDVTVTHRKAPRTW